MCLTPVTLVRDYRTMNGGFTDIVPCGKCPICLKKRQNDWAFRISQEMKRSKSAFFITLTYEETPLSFNGNPTLSKRDFQLFMKRLRKTNYDPIKYYACGEYGTLSHRPHYHAIMFNLYVDQAAQRITSAWPHGHIRIDQCNMATIQYVCKYVTKGTWCPTDELDDREKEFSLMSKKLGMNYLTPAMLKHHQDKQIAVITNPGGSLQRLPRYFKNKIFTKLERQQIAHEMQELAQLNMLDFLDAHHEINWKKDHYRKAEKKLILERSKL